MTSYTWTGRAGNWNMAKRWKPAAGPPKGSDSATIGGSTAFTVTVNSADVANSLTFSDAKATLADDAGGSLAIGGRLTISNGTLKDLGLLSVGTLSLSGGALTVSGQLDLGGTLSQTGGTLTLAGGTISGGTIVSTAGTVAFTGSGGTLSGVTFDGPLNLTATKALQSVSLAKGTRVVGSSGSGPGTINVSGEDSTVYFDNTQTLSKATINLGNSSYDYGDILSEDDTAGAGNQVLTLASSVTVDVQGYGIITDSGAAGDGTINYGAIDVTGSAGALIIDSTSFTNGGTIDLSDAASVAIEPTTFTTTASSVIEIGADSSLTIGPGNGWANLGLIMLGGGATLTLDGSASTSGLGSISNSGGTVSLSGALNNSGQILDGSSFGALTLLGGTIAGGTVTSAGVSFTNYGGALSGVTFEGPLNLASATEEQSVQLANGTIVVGSTGSGPGTINLTGYYSTINFDNTQTVSNETIDLSNANSYNDTLYCNDISGAGNQTLTLASSVTVDVQGSADIEDSDYSGDGTVNDGAIDVTGSAGDLTISSTAFTNSGLIDVTGGGRANIQPSTFMTTASSVITIGANSSLAVAPANGWTNLGSIALGSGANLYLDGSASAASLGAIVNSGGAVDIGGTWNNGGQTLDGSASFGQLVLYGGAIAGGTATSAGVAFSNYGGTLSGVIFEGPLNLTSTSETGQNVALAGGTSIVGSSGSGPGAINVTGYYSFLDFDDSQIVSNATINLGNTSGSPDSLVEYDAAGAGNQVLTLASSVTVNVLGEAYIEDIGVSGDGIVNDGALDVTGSNGDLIIDSIIFTDNGAIDVSGGATATVDAGTFTNLSVRTLTGGVYEAQAGSTVEVYSSVTITIDDADLILSGAGSTIETFNPSTGVTSGVDATLIRVGTTGELQLLAGRGWTTANAAIANNGLVQLGGGTLTSTGAGASLTDTGGSALEGFGTVTVTSFTNLGTIEALGGTLTLTDAVSGTGDLEIAAGATLILAATAATTNAATFNGAAATLTLDNAGNLSGAIGGIGLDDILDLAGVVANGAAVNGSNQLVVTDNGTTVETLQLSGSNSGFSFLTQAVSGSTDVISLPVPATVANYEAYSSLYNQISGGFSVSDTAANISAGLDALNGSNIDAITISDNNAVGIDVAQLASDATAISDLADANGSAYQLAISDTAANVQADLANLEADIAHIASIAVTSGTVAVSLSTFAADQAALDDIVGGFDVLDAAANITASLDSLDGANIDTITISDNGVVGATVAQLRSDATAIGKLANANGTAYQLAITDSLPNILGDLGALNGDSHAVSLTATSGGATLSGGAGVSAAAFALEGSSTVLTVAENFSYSGAFSEGAAATISISKADELSLAGTTSLSGTTSGAGTLDLAGGSAAIGRGAKLSVSNWAISGPGTNVTLGEALTYAKSFSEGAGDTLVLSGGNLLLTGADTFSGGTVDGSYLLETEGTTTISGGLAIGGTMEWENTGTADQSGGTVTIGDSSHNKAFLDNALKGTYDILDDSGVARGSSTASYIENVGVFEKTGGAGTSAITPAIRNKGTLQVTSGTLDFVGEVTGTGTDTISGASTLEFDAAVSSTKALGSQNIGFAGAGTLDLTDPKAFWGEISGFAASDMVELLGSWVFSNFSENSGGTLATLTLASGSTKHAFDFVGSYARGDFNITSGATSTIAYA